MEVIRLFAYLRSIFGWHIGNMVINIFSTFLVFTLHFVYMILFEVTDFTNMFSMQSTEIMH